MPDTLISSPAAAARLSAVMTRCRRRWESACRPASIVVVFVPVPEGVVLVMRRP